jgi:hypothetical protein
MPICEFCSKEAEAIKGTSMTGAYCIECLQLTIHECQEAIKELRKGAHRHAKRRENLISDGEIDQAFSDALQKLMKGPE